MLLEVLVPIPIYRTNNMGNKIIQVNIASWFRVALTPKLLNEKVVDLVK